MRANASARTPRAARRASPARFVALALLLAGCAHVTAPPPARLPRPRPGYEHRLDELASVDASRLAGRRIAIDPGHGGLFRGAIGVNGLTEAQVNLGVAFELRALLLAHGANVFMTRDTDRDFVSPADSSLRFDLAERVRLANAFHPDLFLSIHHNADARGAHDVNETQTYYKLGDDGPSLDAASNVHRYLVRNLGIEKHRILPGNYFVLRSSQAPALLTESSYLTNPDVESKLALSEKRRLEAEAIFLGLARYFSRRVPVIDTVWVYAAGYSRSDTALGGAHPVVAARVKGSFDSARLTLDGAALPYSLIGDSIFWAASRALPVGPHEAWLSARLAGEGASRARVTRFRIVNAPMRVSAEYPDQVIWTGDQPLGMRIRVFDQDGLVYRDTVRVRVRDVGTIRVFPADTQLVLARGEGWLYFRVREWPRFRPRHPVPELKIEAALWPTPRGEFGVPLVDPVRASITTSVPAGYANPIRAGFAIAMPGDTVLRAAPGTLGDDPTLSWINADGFLRLWSDSSGKAHVPRLAGYRAWPTAHDAILAPHDSSELEGFVPVPAAAPGWPPRFVAIAGGALHGRRIVIDPAGGGDDAAGEGASGTRAASLNLEVARALAGFLYAAGADVKLTRDGDYALSDVERVQISEAFHAERFLRIGHAPEPPMLGHYFSSPAGLAWANRTAATFESLGLEVPRVMEDAQYPLQQTSCPALYASPARVDQAGSEERLLSAGALRAEAYALFVALAREWGADAAWAADSLEVEDPLGRPVAGAAITLGGVLVLETDALGRARFFRTEPGPIELEIAIGERRIRRVLLESERGVLLSTGPTGR
ncbi:MAG: N-acetylmuramoyl-L-alanine amidase [Candidatus Eisenbacteria bacterium]|nr:N-acetylmuramoyl-L-alanine amidase [Candidatus Eisenbacteria bacterium]